MSSILTGSSSLLSTLIYLVILCIAILGIGYGVYWTAKLGTRKALKEEHELKLDKTDT